MSISCEYPFLKYVIFCKIREGATTNFNVCKHMEAHYWAQSFISLSICKQIRKGITIRTSMFASTEAEFLDQIQTKVWRVFLLVIHSHLYNFSLKFLFLQLTQPLTVAKEKGGKPDRNLYPLPYGLSNPYRNLRSENSQNMPRNLNEIVCSRIRLQ
jgi:hypothetical protein